MTRLFTILLFCLFAGKLLAAIPAPFPCEAKQNVQVSKLTPELKQWFFLFDLTSTLESEETASPEMEASFESNYWQSFHAAKTLVKNCDQMIAFWQKFGEGIEIFFDQIEAVDADISALSQTILIFEMQKRDKFKPFSQEYPLTIVLEKTNGPLIKPWWNVRTRTLEYVRIFEVPHLLYRERGPLAALFSYEILRKWKRDYPDDFWMKDVLLTDERAQDLALTFPWAKTFFELLTRLPSRDILTNYVTYFCLFFSIPFISRLFWAIYRDSLAKKQK